MIQLIDLHKSFSSVEILKGVNLEIPSGQVTVILGPSGEGKSVLLKHILGLLQPDQGRVIVEGTEIGQLTEKELNQFRKRFGMLFQSAALFDSLSVEENVAFPLREHTTFSEEVIREKVREKLSWVGLEGALQKMPSDLSGGMRKRVGLARAIALEPRIILYDEPTTGLDPLTTATINQLITDMQKKLKVTSIVISHDIESTFETADFVAMLHQGVIAEKGSPESFRHTKNPFIQKFMGLAV